MKKNIISIMALVLFGTGAFAQESPTVKWYGFVRSYFAFDSRESTAGTEDLYFYMPKDRSLNAAGDDLNAIPSFRFAALTSRLGVDIKGYSFGDFRIDGKIEADFYSGVNGVTGTAQLRLRQAYVTVGKGKASWKIGQAWTPMAADLPDIFSLESGAPFGAFSRSPQVTLDYNLGDRFTLTGSAIWQMQYTCTGPLFGKTDGVYGYTASASANYIKYGCTPELYLGLNYRNGGTTLRLGGEIVSIKPRNYDYDLVSGKALGKVDDRLTTWSLFQYGQFKSGNFTFKEKITYALDGSHYNLVGGYGVSKVNSDGSWEYSATRNLSAWATAKWQKKGCNWVPSLFLGYTKMFGTAEDIVGGFWCKNNADKLAGLYRIQPEILYNLGKLQFGLEYMRTAVHYGKAGADKLADEDLHWIANDRIQMLVKYTF